MTMPSMEAVRRRYVHALLAHYGTLTLPLGSSSKDIPLAAVYQPLALRNHPLASSEKEREQEDEPLAHESRVTQEQPVLAQHGAEALEKSPSRHLIILGGPGMGKTTLLKDLLQQALQHALIDTTAPLPLFISLPGLARSGLTLADYVPHLLTELEIEAGFAEHIRLAMTSGQAFFCLDSLDEVLPEQRPDLIAFINREALRCGGTWIIGSRFTEYQGGQFSPSAFAEWTLLPLEAALRRQLANHLFPLLSEILQKPIPSVEAFLQALSTDRRIAEWGGNPLLFSLAAVVYVQHGLLPAHRAALYATIIDVMLQLRVTDLAQRRDLCKRLARVALDFYMTKGRNFTIQDLRELLASYEDDVEKIQAQVVALLDSGVFDVVAYQTYGFEHQMFQEYLAAVALAQQLLSRDEQIAQAAWAFTWRKRTYSRWREILRLLVGVLALEYGEEGSQVAARWLQRLASEHTTADGDPGHLCLILALSSVQEYPALNHFPAMGQATRSLVVVWAEVLVTTLVERNWEYDYRQAWDNSSSTELDRIFTRFNHLLEYIQLLDLSLILPALSYLEQAFAQTKANDVERVMEDKFEQLMYELVLSIPARVLSLAFPEPDQVNLYTIVHAKELDVAVADEALLAILEDPQEDWQARVGAARLLAKVEKPFVRVALLRVLADSTCSYRVRTAVAEALGEQGGAAVAQALVQTAQGPDARLRLAAVKAMGQLGIDMPVSALLMALHDDIQNIRHAAIEALGQLDDQADLEPLLTALHAEDAFVRSGVLEALGIVQARTPCVSVEAAVELLHDPDYDVRLAVVRLLGKIVDVRVLPPLLEAMHETLPEPEHSQSIASAAVNSLHDLSEKLPNLQQWVTEEELVQAFQNKRINHYRLLELAATLRLRLPPELILADFAKTSMYALEQKIHFLAVLGIEAPIVQLLDMLRTASLETQENAARALLSLYRYVPTEPIIAWLQHADITSEAHTVVTRSELLGIAVYLLELLVRQGQEIDAELVVCLLENTHSSTRIGEGVQRICHLLREKAPIARIFGLLCDEREPGICVGIFRDLHELVTPEMIRAEVVHQLNDEVLAIQVLGSMQTEAPVDLLRSILQDNSKNKLVRVHALYTLHDLGIAIPLEYYVLGQDWCFYGVDDNMIEAMTRLGAQAPLSELVHLLGDDNNWVRTSAKRSLKNLAEYVPVELLSPALESENRAMRAEAASVFAAFGERAPVERLLAMVRDEHEHVQVQEAALKTLISIRTDIPVDLLLSLLKVDSYNLRITVFSAFAAMGKDAPLEVLLELLKHDKFGNDAVEVLGCMAERAPIDLLLTLFDDAKSPVDRHRIARAFARLGEYAPMEEIRARFYSVDGEMCWALIDAFGEMREYAPVDLILQALESDNSEVRDAADLALFQLSEDAPAKLVADARHDFRPAVRKRVLDAVAKLGPDAPLEIVLAALEEKETRGDAFAVLVGLNVDMSSLFSLDEFLEKICENEEKIALLSPTGSTLLAHYGAQVPVELLLSQSHDCCFDAYVARALYKTHPDVFREVVAPQAEAILRGEPAAGVFAARVQARIATTIGRIGRVTPAVLNMVVELLDPPDQGTRLEAIRALGAIHRNIPDRALRRLLELRQDQAASEVRQAADAALAEILAYEEGMEDE